MSSLRIGQTWRLLCRVHTARTHSRYHCSRVFGETRPLQKLGACPPPPVAGVFSPPRPRPTWFPAMAWRGLLTSGGRLEEMKTVAAPPFAESVSEGDVRWEKAVGDYVEEDEVIAEIETDKTALQVPAPVGGVLEELLVADGDTVTSGMDLARIRVSGPDTGATPTPSSTTEPATQETTPPPPAVEATPTPSSIPSSPPLPPPLPVEPMSTSPPPLPLTAPSLGGVSRAEKRVKMNRMRQRIAERLKDAQNTNAMLTTFNEVDMSNIIEMRRKWKEDFLEKHGVKLGFMSPFVKAACHALLHQPVVNAVIDGNQIIYRDYVDISIAVATPKGLVVPVLRNVETMNCADIEKTTAQLGQKARDGTLAIEDMDGGTFTISNGGVFGSLFGTPIINPPQSAILGMHATVDRPVAIQGKVEVRPMMYVALTYDHRLIDGREAVLFLKKIKQAVEDPRVFLLGL